MTDTGIRYTHCRGPHCGGMELRHPSEREDGLCLSNHDPHRVGCYARAAQWAEKHCPRAEHAGLDSPEWSVAIDQWLEAGAP